VEAENKFKEVIEKILKLMQNGKKSSRIKSMTTTVKKVKTKKRSKKKNQSSQNSTKLSI